MAIDTIARALSGQASATAADAKTTAESAVSAATSAVPAAVTAWLDANVDPVGSAVVVDSSLTISGAAADAKATGDEITDLKNAITNITGNTEYSWNVGQTRDYPNVLTPVGPYPTWASVLVPCSPGDVFSVKGYGGNSSRLWIFADSTGAALTASQTQTHLDEYEYITAPESAAYLACNTNLSQTSYPASLIKGKVLITDINQNVERDLYYEQYGNKYFSMANIGMTKGAYLSASTGKKVSNSDVWVSDFVPVYAGMQFEYRLSTGASVAAICAYRNEDEYETSFISCIMGSGYAVATTGVYTVPDGANYIRVSSLIWDNATDTVPYSHVQDPFFRIAGSVDEEYTPNIYDYNSLNARSGYYIKASDGLMGGSTAAYIWATLDYIKVEKGSFIKYALIAPTNAAAIAYYDKYKNFLRVGLQGHGNNFNERCIGYLKIPEDCEYIRVCYSTDPAYEPLFEITNYPLIRSTEFQFAKKAVANAKRYNTSLTEPFSLLHFSDVHGTSDTIANIVRFWNEEKPYVDDAICTGDMVRASSADGMDFWNSVSGSEKILMTVGNHDQQLNGNTMSQAEQYALYIQPYVSYWGATTVADKTWWYKDYADNNIRLIGLGSTYVMPSEDLSAMNTWLGNVLTDAKTNGLSVIIAEHYPPNNPVAINGAFTEKDWTPSGITLDDSVLNVVDTFITGGGEFICYICGHTHQDLLLYSSDHPNQIFVSVTTASTAFAQQAFSDLAREANLDIAWAYNILSVDTNSKHIRLIRVGANLTMNMEKRECMVLDYTNKLIVSQNGNRA